MKKVALLLFSVVLIGLAVLMLGCSLEGDDNPNKNPPKEKSDPDPAVILSNIDITNAKALIVGPAKIVTGSGSADTLIKLTTSDVLELVVCKDEKSKDVDIDPPSAVYDAGEYLILVFKDRTYLVNKVTGATYILPREPTPIWGDGGASGLTRKSVYWDAEGHIYFMSIGIVRKINISDPDAITVEKYTPDVDEVEDFAVDADGNVIYQYQAGKRLKKSNGGLFNMPSNSYAFWTGLDGTLYAVYSAAVNVKNITVDQFYEVSISDHADLSGITTYQGYQYIWLYFDDRILIICDNSYEVDNPSGVPRKLDFDFLDSSSRKIVKNSEDYYYVATKSGEIIKVNPLDDTYSTLLDPGDYDIYKMAVSADNSVIFNALRMSDGKKVLARISSLGVLEILDETLTKDIVLLEKLN